MTGRDFAGPDCGVGGCQREQGHIGDHRRVEEITPRSIDRASFGLVDDDGDGYGGRAPQHPGDCPATLAYGHDTHTRGCVEYTPWSDERLRICGHTDPRSCDLTCRLLGSEATQADSVGRLRVMVDAEVRDRTALLDREIVRLRQAIEDFILWWDMPPYVLDDDDGLRMEVDELRAAIGGTEPTGDTERIVRAAGEVLRVFTVYPASLSGQHVTVLDDLRTALNKGTR